MELADFLVRVRADYPQLRFVQGRKFTFRSPRTIIFEDPKKDLKGLSADQCSAEQNNYCLQILHELGHALLKHRNFATDPDRLKMERAAWEEARRLVERYKGDYQIDYDEEFVEVQLDTYRDWLHQKSCCPQCGLTRYQTPNGEYHCPLCER